MWKCNILTTLMVLILIIAVQVTESKAQAYSSGLQEPARHPVAQEQQNSTTINRRYQEMLAANQNLRNAGSVKTAQSRYQLPENTKSYVQRQLPTRLVPPGRNLQQKKVQQFQQPQLNAPQQTMNQAPVVQYSKQSPIAQQLHQRPQATQGYLHPGTTTTNEQFQRHANLQQHNDRGPAKRLPNNHVRQQHQAASPKFYNSGMGQRGSRAGYITKQPKEQKILKRSIKIPVSADDDSNVTRARIVLVQDTGDPFGQPQDQNSDSGQFQEDPFADPEDDQLPNNQTGDPFADPPGDLTPQQGDPFADPPGALDPNQRSPEDPFADPPNKIQDVDPFPENPGDIKPGENMDPDPMVKDPRDPDIAPRNPDETPEKNKRPDQPRVKLGPFKPREGFKPSPILPAPPRRERESIVQVPQTYMPFIEYQDQPTHFGQSFDKSQIYEGIDTGLIEAGIENEVVGTARPFARRKIVDRFNRFCQDANCTIPGCRGGCMSPSRISSFESMDEGHFFAGPVCEEVCEDVCFEPMFYVSVFGGYLQLEDMGPVSQRGFTIGGGVDSTAVFDDGVGVGVALGQFQGPNLRTELELSYRFNNASSIFRTSPVSLGSTSNTVGSAESLTGMFNMVWDFNPRPVFGRWRPYAGGGLGFTILDIDVTETVFDEVNESQSSFAFQLMAGASRPISSRMDGFVEYRYLHAESVRLVAGSGAGSVEYESDNIFFGVRMHF